MGDTDVGYGCGIRMCGGGLTDILGVGYWVVVLVTKRRERLGKGGRAFQKSLKPRERNDVFVQGVLTVGVGGCQKTRLDHGELKRGEGERDVYCVG